MDGRQRAAGLVDGTGKARAPARDDHQRIAQPFSVRHHMRREQDGGAAVAFGADQRLKPFLVDRIEAGEGLVEHDEIGAMHDGGEQLHLLRHALGQGLDPGSAMGAETVRGEQRVGALTPFGPRQPAQCAHVGDRLARGHRRIEAALLGQVADAVGDLQRVGVAEQAPLAAVGFEDAEEQAQRRSLARAILTEEAEDRTFRHDEIDTVDGRTIPEALDQSLRFDRRVHTPRARLFVLC